MLNYYAMKKKKFSASPHRCYDYTLCGSTRKTFRSKRSTVPLLNTPDVKNFLRMIGFEADLVTLIGHKKTFLWLARGRYKNEPAVFSLSFYACIIRWHWHAPLWPLGCAHSVITIGKNSYRMEERGTEIYLIKLP